jgi:hypothetical protein
MAADRWRAAMDLAAWDVKTMAQAVYGGSDRAALIRSTRKRKEELQRGHCGVATQAEEELQRGNQLRKTHNEADANETTTTRPHGRTSNTVECPSSIHSRRRAWSSCRVLVEATPSSVGVGDEFRSGSFAWMIPFAS